ncbi:MAG TPA: hypothetical protein VNN24_03085 [Candidatus Binatus sp.]|nr:hypothetical protein [Candidatus Binatus sp.]
MTSSSLWQRFQQYFLSYADLGFSIDISRMKFPDDFLEKIQPRMEKAFAAMRGLESGAIANPDEKLTTEAGKTAEEIARSIDADPEDVFHALRHLASNDPQIRITAGDQTVDEKFSLAK